MQNQWLKSGSSNRQKLIDFTITMNQQPTPKEALARFRSRNQPKAPEVKPK